MFLSQQQIIELTGYKLGAHQIRWLVKWDIPHFVGASGRPVVKESVLDRLMGADKPIEHKPDFTSFRKQG